MEKLEYITQKALIKCSDGGAPGFFTPSYNTTVKINGCLVATDVDKIPMANIPTFIVCAKTQKPCVPAPTMWQDTYPVKVKGKQTLLGKSCMQCSIGGKMEFLMSGQIPLSAEEEAEVNGMRDNVQKSFDAEQKEANKPWWQKAGEFALDMVPVVGPIVSLVKNVSEGNWGMAALDVGFLALDVVGLVATPFTGGASLAASTAAKAGLRATVKGAVKATAKKMSKEAIKAGAKQTGEMLAKLSVKNLTRGKLCVFACFPAGTPVAVKDGYSNIKDIKVGDEVWAWDEASGELALRKIISTLQREVHALVELTIEGETIYATPEHPFFVDGKWKEAGLLEINDQVQLFTSKQARVQSVQFTGAYSDTEVLQVNKTFEVLDIGSADHGENTTVYNLEVDGFNTYFVGWLKALVHNTDICLAKIGTNLIKEFGIKLPVTLKTLKAGLKGEGKELLEGIVKKTENIAEHLTDKDVTGALRDILDNPVIINGKTYNHLGEVEDAMTGMSKQLKKLDEGISSGKFSDEVLKEAERVRSGLSNEKDRILNIITQAKNGN